MSGKNIKELFLYLIVGGIATVTEWILFYIFNDILLIHYILSTVIAYILSTFVNWISGKIIVFKNTKHGIIFEILSIYAASIIGLLLNIGIMWVLIEILKINSMISKIIATILVFIWNFVIRKFYIYKINGD